jgi:hypothetical protein
MTTQWAALSQKAVGLPALALSLAMNTLLGSASSDLIVVWAQCPHHAYFPVLRWLP